MSGVASEMAGRAQPAYQRPAGWVAPGAELVASAAAEVIPRESDLGRVHLIGIAGAGMSALARLMVARGIDVSGCERRESEATEELRGLGARVLIGHAAAHLDGVDTVVYSTAIPPSHLERVVAVERGLRLLRRASALGALVAGHRAIAVAGTHGKTTTCSLIVAGAVAAGLDPSFATGASLHASAATQHTNGYLGTGREFVVEADESDGSFLLLRPDIAVVTNVEADHLENHGDLEGLFSAFELFVDRIAEDGLLIACLDDPGARRVADHARRRGLRVRGYGRQEPAEVLVADVVSSEHAVRLSVVGLAPHPVAFTVSSLVGSHMALNAAAAAMVLTEMGADLSAVQAGWQRFGGVDRRFELHGSAGGVRVYDDYAHHPTEVRAQLLAARAVLDTEDRPGRLIAVFQPGTYSRTQTFATEFGQALAVADLVVVMDIYPAREEPIPGVSGALIADRVPLPADRVAYEPDWHAVPERVGQLAADGDLVLTMGIGDVYLLCPQILAAIESRARDGAGDSGDDSGCGR